MFVSDYYTNKIQIDMKTQSARAAQAIRKELKANYPNVKFSVRSQNYSMGDNVNVSYTDGPLEKEVEALLAKYEYGKFDGMTDCYDVTNRRDDIPQTKYLFVERSASEASESMIQFYIANKHPQQPDNMNIWAWEQYLRQEFGSEFRACAYPEKIHNNELAIA